MTTLRSLVETLLEDCGFPEELYLIHEKDGDVFVEIRDKSDANYILKIAEEDNYKNFMVGQYSRNGRIHIITFFHW